MNRTEFYYKQRVTSPELNDDTLDPVEQADWSIVKEALGFGVFGTPVVLEQGTPDLTVDVPIFNGYDQLGRRLEKLAITNVNCAVDEVAASTAVGAAPNEKWLSVFAEFTRLDSDPRTDGNGTPLFWIHDEDVKFNVVQAAEQTIGTDLKPTPRSNQVLLCDIYLIFGQTQILNADIYTDRREDFAYLELTGSYLGTLLGFIGRALQPANLTAPSAVSMVVTTEMAGKTAGGSATQKGVITSNPENYVKLFDDDGDNFLDTNGNKVYGRLTEAAGVWTLSFYTFVEGTPGVETAFDMTPFAAQTVLWFVQQVYSLDSFPVADPMFAVQSDQIAGEIPLATTTVAGKVELATDGEAVANKVVQGDDSRLLGSPALALIRKLSSRPSLIFMHEDSADFDRFLLHQYHGMAFGDYTGGGPSDFYFEYDKDHADYPLAVLFDANGVTEGPGNADNTGASIIWTSSSTWYYIFLIARPSGSPKYALVCSTRAPDTGPLLDNSVFDFPAAGWTHWKYIGAVVNMNDDSTTWELAQTRKIGNHVSYELAMYMLQTSTTAGSWAALDLSERVPLTAMRAEIQLLAECADGAIAIKARPPVAVANELGLREVAGVGPSTIPGSRDCTLQALASDFGDGAPSGVAGGEANGWVDLNDQREIGWNAGEVGSPTSKLISLLVKGYQEFDDFEGTSFTWA